MFDPMVKDKHQFRWSPFIQKAMDFLKKLLWLFERTPLQSSLHVIEKPKVRKY
jgi:hypothetical protein